MGIKLPIKREIGNSKNPYKELADKKRKKDKIFAEDWVWRGDKGNASFMKKHQEKESRF